MALIGRALRTGLALKALRFVQREMSKPENQRRAKELIAKGVASRRKAQQRRSR